MYLPGRPVFSDMFIKQEQHEAQQQQLIEVRDSSHTNSGQIGVFNSQSNLYVQISSQEYNKICVCIGIKQIWIKYKDGCHIGLFITLVPNVLI